MNSFPGSPGLPPPPTTTTTSNLSHITVFSKYIKEPSLGCPCLHKLPASLLYSGWCRFFFLLSVPARLYSPCEALCSCTAHSYSPTVHEGVLGTHSILLFNWSTPGLSTGRFSHMEGLLRWNPLNFITNCKTGVWGVNHSKRNTLNHHLTFNIN